MKKREIEQMALRIKLLEEDSRRHDLKIREQGLAIHRHDDMFMLNKAAVQPLLDEQMRKNVTVTISREDASLLLEQMESDFEIGTTEAALAFEAALEGER